MHLAERRRSQRGVVEAVEQCTHGGADLVGDEVADILGGNGVDVVLQSRQRLGVGLRQEVVAGGEQLAELDVGGAHRLEVGGELLRAVRGTAGGRLVSEELVGSTRGQDAGTAVPDQQPHQVAHSGQLRSHGAQTRAIADCSVARP